MCFSARPACASPVAFLQASGLRWNGDAGQCGSRNLSRHVLSGRHSRVHRASVNWRQRRGLLPPPVRGRDGEGGGNRLGIGGHPPPCPSPAGGEGTPWRGPSQREARGRVWLLSAAVGLLLTLPNSPSHAAEPPRHVVSFNVCADQLVVTLADPGQIAALSPHATNEVLSTVVEKARAFPRTGWTAESVVPFEPDLVLMGYSWDRSPTLQMMRALGLRLAPIGLVDDFDGALAQIHDVAALLGRPERGEALAAEIAAARRRLANARQPTP